MSSLSSVEAALPPGFRFHPRDEELVCDYLMKRVTGRPTHPSLIHLHLHNCEPWDLPDIACVGGKEWYFYTQRDRKYATGLRTNRATNSGYWKATGKDRPVSHKGKRVGMRKTLVFYAGRAPKGSKTEWVMHEYRLEEGAHYGPGPKAVSPVKEDWVLCRVFLKKASENPSKIQVETKASSPSLPPLMEPYNNNSTALNQSSDAVNKHVPCFSIYSTNPTYSHMGPPEGLPSPDGTYDINPLFMNDYPFPSCDDRAIKVVLSQLVEMDAPNDFGEGSSHSYVYQAVSNPYPRNHDHRKYQPPSSPPPFPAVPLPATTSRYKITRPLSPPDCRQHSPTLSPASSTQSDVVASLSTEVDSVSERGHGPTLNGRRR
ncbi:NAC domain-containing protein 21/22 [Striga hermonthica]|uniref:NAC domain-containing protein 21/22 n=1 Tax=Striga hermonthica TaxID=68872 RepID=A0A9N7NL51_STRHE|nr:NAC domain-containing protein 21/22 [Striga hermonthica]